MLHWGKKKSRETKTIWVSHLLFLINIFTIFIQLPWSFERVRKQESREYTNHEAKREGADDRERQRNSGELNIAEMADEDVGDGIDGELAQNVENDRQRNLPQAHGFYPENLLCRLELLHRSVVAVLLHHQRRRRSIRAFEQRSVRVHVNRRQRFANRRVRRRLGGLKNEQRRFEEWEKSKTWAVSCAIRMHCYYHFVESQLKSMQMKMSSFFSWKNFEFLV